MAQNLLKFIANQGYFSAHNNVLIAVSGGADSMSLLHFFYDHQEYFAVTIAIAHVNHKQRPESDKEEAYLCNWAKEHNVPFYSTHFTGQFSEKAARDFRYNFFKKIMEQNNYTALLTAHHFDDQVETIFMRLLRGSRLRHLKGMEAVSPFANGQLIRPFLTFKKTELPQFFHFEDSSNASQNYLRNRVRLTYLPALENENPQFSRHLIRLSEESGHLLKALSDLTADIDVTDVKLFQRQTKAVQLYLLQRYLDDFPDLQLSYSQFTDLLTMLQNSKKYQLFLKSGYFLYKDADTFSLNKEIPSLKIKEGTIQLLFGQTAEFSGYRFTFSDEINSEKKIAIDASKPLILRHRQAGDQIFFGNHHKKLRRLFIDKKIPQNERQKAIVGQQENEIVFVLIKDELYLKKFPENAILRGTVNIIKLL